MRTVVDLTTGQITQAPDADLPVISPSQVRASFVASAIAELGKTDMVAIRCLKAGVAIPAEWQSYVSALRDIVRGVDTTSTVLPSAPAYPSGT